MIVEQVTNSALCCIKKAPLVINLNSWTLKEPENSPQTAISQRQRWFVFSVVHEKRERPFNSGLILALLCVDLQSNREIMKLKKPVAFTCLGINMHAAGRSSLLLAALTGPQLNTSSQWHSRHVWMRLRRMHISPGHSDYADPYPYSGYVIVIHHVLCAQPHWETLWCNSVSTLSPFFRGRNGNSMCSCVSM